MCISHFCFVLLRFTDDDAGNSIAAAYACLTTGKANVAFVNLENGLNCMIISREDHEFPRSNIF